MLCATSVVSSASSSAGDADRLARHVGSIRQTASVIRFFEHHRWLLDDPRFEGEAGRRLAAARRSLVAMRVDAARARAKRALARASLERSERRATQRRLVAQVARSPHRAICYVFHGYCGQALQVARCESRLRTTARNGQYLGMFQMGTTARQLYGHGETPLAQARAAYRYFVDSGRDWSPWSCKPW
jgi:hypothetical protein